MSSSNSNPKFLSKIISGRPHAQSSWDGPIRQTQTQPLEELQRFIRRGLMDFCGRSESRTLVLLHSMVPSLCNPELLKLTCERFGSLSDLRVEYQIIGITLICYYDIRSAIFAQRQLPGLLRDVDPALSVWFSTAFVFNATDPSRIIVRNMIIKEADGGDVEGFFKQFGEVRSVNKRVGGQGQDGGDGGRATAGGGPEVEYNVDFCDVHGAFSAFDKLSKAGKDVSYGVVDGAELSLRHSFIHYMDSLLSIYGEHIRLMLQNQMMVNMNPNLYYAVPDVPLMTHLPAMHQQQPYGQVFGAHDIAFSHQQQFLAMQNALAGVHIGATSPFQSQPYQPPPPPPAQQYASQAHIALQRPFHFVQQGSGPGPGPGPGAAQVPFYSSDAGGTNGNISIITTAGSHDDGVASEWSTTSDGDGMSPSFATSQGHLHGQGQGQGHGGGPGQSPRERSPHQARQQSQYGGGSGHNGALPRAYPPHHGNHHQDSIMGTTSHSTTGMHARRSTQSQHSTEADYLVDIERVMSRSDLRTTIMIRNIPNKYTQSMLLKEINSILRVGTYDFYYLPIDFKNRCNVGYAFINFLEPEMVVEFCKHFNGRKWCNFNSEKVCSLSYARIQGKSALVARYQNSSLMSRDNEYRPLLFYSSGPDKGLPEPFPIPVRHDHQQQPQSVDNSNASAYHLQQSYLQQSSEQVQPSQLLKSDNSAIATAQSTTGVSVAAANIAQKRTGANNDNRDEADEFAEPSTSRAEGLGA